MPLRLLKQIITPWTFPLLRNFNTTVNWNAQNSADSEIFATTTHGCKGYVDLNNAFQFRMNTKYGGTGNAGAKLYIKASVGASGVHKLQDISDASTTGDNTYSINAEVNGAWVNIDPAYRLPGVLITVYGSGGNSATALALRMIEAEFR